MAVSLPDGAPNQWWAPDGRAVTGDLETRGLSCPGGGSGWARRMVFRAVNLPAGSDGLYFEAAGGMSVAARSSALLNGRELSGGWTACYSDPSGGRRIEPEVGVAVDPWRPLAAYHPDGRPAGSRRSPGDPHPRLQVHGTSDSPEGARITAVLERESRDWRFRIVAVDASGVEHTERSMSGSLGPSGDDAVVTFTFHGLRLDAVREFVAQARPVRWVRFPGVAMEPSGPRPEGRRPMASRTVSADDDGILSSEFPGLGRVDLLALGQPEAAPGGWWRADGRPVPGPGFAVRGVSDVAVAGRALDLVLRLPGVGEGVTGPLFRFDPDSAAGGGGEVWAGGVPLVGGRPLRVVWPREAVRGRIRVGFASGPWQVVSHHAPAGGGRIVDRLGAHPDPDARIQSVSAGDGGLELTVVSATRTGSDPDRVWRWVAVDRRSGLPTAPSGPGVGSPAGPGEVLTLKFPGLDLAGVAEFQLQARTVEWAEFPLWLEPRSPVPAPVPRVFGDPVERAYDGVVDLDSGRVGRFPGGHGSDPFGGLAEDVAWMAGEGFDLSADLPMPSVLGVVWVPLETDSWTGMTPAQVEERLSNSGVSRVRMESPDGRHDAVFGFRTREGTVGLLRVVGRPGTDRRLVWKRVASPAP